MSQRSDAVRARGVLAACIAALAASAPGAAAAHAQGLAPAAYDRSGMTHNIQCIATNGDRPVAVRDVEGEPLRVLAGGRSQQLADPPLHALAEPGGRRCIRIQGLEALDASGLRMYYTWPFEPDEVARGAAAQYPGLVAASELAEAPALDRGLARAYGRPAPAAPGEPAYVIAPADMNAPEQLYHGPSSGRLYSYSPYGKDVGGAQFALLTWTWIDAAGGGIARAAVAEGERFYPADVEPIEQHSVAADGHTVNGEVIARYGYVAHGSERTYGWMATSHVVLLAGETRCVDQMRYAGGGPALAGTLCAEANAAPGGLSPWAPSLSDSSAITALLAERPEAAGLTLGV